MRFCRSGFVGLGLFIILSLPANAGSLGIVGGYVIDNGYISPTTGFTIQAKAPQLGGGLLIGFDLVKGGSAQIELGALYMPRGLIEVVDSNQSTVTLSQTTVQVPLLLRVSILPVLSLGAGAFVSYALTTPSNLNTIETGAVGSVAFRFGFQKTLDLVFDVRSQFGLTDLSSVAGFGVYLYDYQGLVGVILGF